MAENKSILTVHTVAPEEIPVGHDAESYRKVVGVSHGDREVWLPGEHEGATSSDFKVPEKMAGGVLDYVEAHYGPEAREQYRNCHLGAAAITGEPVRREIDAQTTAVYTVYDGEKVTDLAPGQWGALGNQEYGAYHSVVGIAPGLGIQTDSEYGPLSLVKHPQNLAHHEAATGDKLALYAPKAPRQ